RQQLEETEGEPPPPSDPGKSPGAPRPSAYLMPYELSAIKPQPVHGFISRGSDEVPVHAVKDEIADVPTRYFFPPQVDETIGYYDDITPILSGDLEAPVEKNAASSMMSAHTELASSGQNMHEGPIDPTIEFADQQLPDSRLVAMLTPDEMDIVIPDAEGSSATSVESEDALVQKAAEQAQKGQDLRRTRKAGKPKLTASTNKKHLPMVVMPPLPSVNIDAANPFVGSGVDVARPIMFNVVR
ncbi:MAG: hypothetical protein K2X29_07160, partial [Candidatus Obscuribacterales bacterium]|nr:hypothetical protein [Candidatus Obscuribacterales bacterium]